MNTNAHGVSKKRAGLDVAIAFRPIHSVAGETLPSPRTQDTKLVMATHDLGRARLIAAHANFLLNGKNFESAAAADFLAVPETAAAQAFLKGDIVE